jgi:hypothetical protein
MASQIEDANKHKGTIENVVVEPQNRIKSKMTNVNNPVQDDALKAAFDSIFG